MNEQIVIPTQNGYAVLSPEDLRRLARNLVDEEDRVLGMGDVVRLTPWSRTKIIEMRELRQIPMIWKNGRWIITKKNYMRVVDDGFPDHVGKSFRTPERKFYEVRPITREMLKLIPKDMQKQFRERLRGLI